MRTNICRILFLALCAILFAPAPASARHYRAGWGYQAQYSPYYGGGWSWGYPEGYYRAQRRVRRHSARHYRSESRGWSYSASGNSLVAEARSHIGTNPTGWSRVWCGHFVDMVLRRTGHRGGGNLARGYAHYGRRVSGPQVGAIAVMGRRGGGGHVGVVSGIDKRGNPVVVSGNTWGQGSSRRRVLETVVPRGRVYAYVMPTD